MGVTVSPTGVVVAAVTQFVIGALWYSVFFGDEWVQAMKDEGHPVFVLPKDKLKAFMKKKDLSFAFFSSALCAFVRAIVLAYTLKAFDLSGIEGGAICGAVCWVGFVFTTMHHNVWSMRSMKGMAIDLSMELVGVVAQGAILGWFSR